MRTVKVRLFETYGKHPTGAEVALPLREADDLVRAGKAVYTQPIERQTLPPSVRPGQYGRGKPKR